VIVQIIVYCVEKIKKSNSISPISGSSRWVEDGNPFDIGPSMNINK
jgi:hypothetical protein